MGAGQDTRRPSFAGAGDIQLGVAKVHTHAKSTRAKHLITMSKQRNAHGWPVVHPCPAHDPRRHMGNGGARRGWLGGWLGTERRINSARRGTSWRPPHI